MAVVTHMIIIIEHMYKTVQHVARRRKSGDSLSIDRSMDLVSIC